MDYALHYIEYLRLIYRKPHYLIIQLLQHYPLGLADLITLMRATTYLCV